MRPTSWLDIRLRLAIEQLGLIVRVAAFLLLFYLGAGVVGTLDFDDEQIIATLRRRELYAHNDDWPKLQELAAKLQRKRERDAKRAKG